jgi:hypothetical protein
VVTSEPIYAKRLIRHVATDSRTGVELGVRELDGCREFFARSPGSLRTRDGDEWFPVSAFTINYNRTAITLRVTAAQVGAR